MNKLRPIKTIGMPWHGLATNGTLTTTSDGDKAISGSGSPLYVGPCLPVIHPSAPGATRNTAQQAKDTADGLEWRNYALLCGANHAVNGGPELGTNSWLYCDSGGATWVIRVETVKSTSTITFKLWLDAIFGRFGRQRSFTAQLLDSVVWSPDIPSWYTGGITAATIVTAADAETAVSVAPSTDGSQCYINIYSDNDTVSDGVYPETQPINSTGTFQGDSLIGVLVVNLSGAGDLDDDGSGITGTIAEDLAYEGGLVTNREKWVTQAWGTPLDWDYSYPLLDSASGNTCPADDTTTYDFTYTHTNITGDYEYSTSRTGSEHTAILYKAPWGTVTRTYASHYDPSYRWIELEGAYACSMDLSNCSTDGPQFNYPVGSGSGGGGTWFITSCTQGAQTLGDRTHQIVRNYVSVSYDVFGQVYSANYETKDDIEEHGLHQTFPSTSTQIPNCGSFPSEDASTQTLTATLNGTSLDTSGGMPSVSIYHECRILAPNLVYVVRDYNQTDLTDRDMVENVVAVDDSGVASEIYSDTTAHAALGGSRKIPDAREIVWSWQPVTEESTHTSRTLFASYSGDYYQYC